MVRKLTLQLTPLLDLLLIVIFAQYMEIQETAQRSQVSDARKLVAVQDNLEQADQTLSTIRDEKETLVQELAEQQEVSHDLLQQRTEAERTAKTEIVELTRTLERTREQRDALGGLVVELFQVPEQLLVDVLSESTPDDAQRTRDQIETIRSRAKELARYRADEMVKHLLTFEELRKRCDIWDLYITEQGECVLTQNGRTSHFRANTANEFQQKLFDAYKGLPQPKSLVLILLSYGDTRAKFREAAITGLPQASERMRADSNGRTRFEYTVLGFRPDRAGAAGR